MVALLVGLRWRQLGHQLSRNVWMIVSLVVLGLMAIGLLSLLAFGLSALRVFVPDAVSVALILAGSVITLGWWLGSILVSADELLAPERFSLLPVRADRLLPGLVVAGALGIGGIGTSLALLLMLLGWSVQPIALVAAVLLAPVALAICVLGARVVSGLLAKWLAGRRTRDLVVVVGTLLLASSGILVNVVLMAVVQAEDAGGAMDAVADVLAWTPVGAAFGVPAALVDGEWAVAGLRLVIALATVAVLWLVARAMLAARLVAPIISRGGGQVRGGKMLDRLLPATPAGAIAARSLRYRRRDPRHILNTVLLVLLPFLIMAPQAMSLMGGGMALGGGVILVPAICALMVCTIVQMDVAYDHDAVALHLLAGVRGVDDRAGRVLAVVVIAVPVVVVLSVLACLVVGDWALLPASLGASLGLVLAAAGAGALVGSWLPGRAPAPEANPLGRGSSGGVQSFAALAIMVPAILVVGAPAFGFAIAALWNPALGWISLASGLILGAAAAWGGIVLGGRILDRRWPEVLIAVSSEA
ncbi:hypothetical protein [Microbacterium marinilacus]|uniref:ABC-2 type transport system permease protein n=1 Tax=Microbacterium marinilacus TaxID=415209 RepID=A0ABP7BLM2_9MICO|nr:hypothetical protein [Microbacterium marinilacus]MBY0689673.1 hypothetical protein [Microbacterium marinilacus]